MIVLRSGCSLICEHFNRLKRCAIQINIFPNVIKFSEGVQHGALLIGQANSEVESVGGLKRRCTALF